MEITVSDREKTSQYNSITSHINAKYLNLLG
jgi:hypothetical protein